jgi:hypothetical protein
VIPSSDILEDALMVIDTDTVQYYSYYSDVTNDAGIVIPTYLNPIDVDGSLQAMPLSQVEKLGYDMSREYVVFFAQMPMYEASRDRGADYFTFNENRYSIVNVTNWHMIDGWAEVTAIKEIDFSQSGLLSVQYNSGARWA